MAEREPYPDYVYSEAASARADGIQRAARRATFALADGPLFDTEPSHMAKTLARLAESES